MPVTRRATILKRDKAISFLIPLRLKKRPYPSSFPYIIPPFFPCRLGLLDCDKRYYVFIAYTSFE
jgi:hypothetical protein